MRRADFLRLCAVGLLTAATAGCTPAPARVPLGGRRILVPAAPGGGYDLTARTVAGLLLESDILPGPLEVFNLPGGGGVHGLSRLTAETGDDRLIMAMGLGVVGSAVASAPHLDPADATPLARLFAEPGAVLVPSGSPFADAAALFARWRESPGGIRVGGGSTVGGPDHLFAVTVARRLGIPADAMVFVPYSGGGDVVTGMLSGSVDVGFAGAGEVRPYLDSGALRALAVSAGDRLDGIPAPTLIEAGVDVRFENWRGLIGPADMPDDERERWLDALRRLQALPGWRDALVTHGWRDAYLEGEEFRGFLRDQRAEVQRILAGG